MGRVIDEEIARDKSIPCTGYRYISPKTGETKYLMWKPSILGTLTNSQEKMFCDLEISDIKVGLTPKLEKRFDILRGLEAPQCIDKVTKEKLLGALRKVENTEEVNKIVEKIPTCQE